MPTIAAQMHVASQTYYWDTNTLAWVAGTQPSGGAGGGGDASAANQALEIASLASIDGKIPASPATTGKQDTGNTSLGNIDTAIGAQANSTWDGSAAASIMSIVRYVGVKLEAIRALLASPLHTIIDSSASIAVTGPLTDTQLRASAVPVSSTTLSTEATLALVKAKTDNLDTALSGIKTGTDKIISAPATSAKQDTAQTSLDAIKTDVDKIPALGQALAAGSVPVVLTAIQVSALTPPAAITGFALEAGHLATIDSHIPAQGQALAAGSVPVVLTAIQQTALTPPAAITGFALESTQLTGNTSIASVKTNTDPLVTSGAGGYVRQDSTATIAKESGGNLATVKTNTDPLVTSGAGGYVRQDSTNTMALETGGNLALLPPVLASMRAVQFMQLAFAAAYTNDQFVPMEIPDFLGGL